ncbi:acetyl-CoA synthetase-like protein [Piromyces finnis]|uniref:Acetyl-CoA synthetase-like protein n=1 Tax=Piromyces finnis TaxID=1754191 RepID=A0A1Y1V281_9FUNG|nr:acetyl-CoA synthetase-like protein [Piromyces finnis]|eukprot:ORX45414.1 acetyl-CoA synthetase-like protein [Piromyces finnis]
MDHQSDQENSLYNLFLNKVHQYPKRIAAHFISLNTSLLENYFHKSLSYEHLNNDILNLEIWLKKYNLKKGDYIYVLLDPSLMLVSIILTCWKKKYVYIPINEGYINSIQNNKFIIIENSKLKNLSINNYKQVTCPFYPEYSLLISEILDARENNFFPIEKYNFQYIMHTSGTTRKNKNGIAVRVSEDSLYSNVIDIINQLKLKEISHYYGILMTSPSFDPSLIEIFVTLTLGGTLIIPSRNLIKSTNYLYKSCFIGPVIPIGDNSEINLTLMMTPSHLFNFGKNSIREILTGKTNVKNLILGGEKFPSLSTLIDMISGQSNNFRDINSVLGISLWNIYGITENSVWASLYRVENFDFLNCLNNKEKRITNSDNNDSMAPDDDKQNCNTQQNFGYTENDLKYYSSNNVPLGKPLSNTIFLLRYMDMDGIEKLITIQKDSIQYYQENTLLKGRPLKNLSSIERVVNSKYYIIGELWIGGNRQCWVDLDDNYQCGEYIFTGDIVLFNKINNYLYYYGRTNQQIKYSGYRIHLEQCNFALEKISFVNKCYTMMMKIENIEELVSFITYNGNITNSKVENDIKSQLKRLLPFYAIPSHIIILDDFPLNKNGKIDAIKLQQIYKDQMNDSYQYSLDIKTIMNQYEKPKAISIIIKYLLNEMGDSKETLFFKTNPDKLYFFELGGNSLQATHIAQKLNKLINKDKDFSKELSLCIMNYSFQKVANKVYRLMKSQDSTENLLDSEENANENQSVVAFNNKIKYDTAVINDTNSNKKFIGFISKAQTFIIDHDTLLDDNKNLGNTMCQFHNQTTFNFKKCIDASPTISISKVSDHLEYSCFIGSHSSLFMSINITKKSVNWKVSLNDRIEGSACLSLCGRYIIVGCYDYYIYILSVDDGHVVWKYKTKDIVKCTPVLNPEDGHVWFGGYDKILYEIDIDDKQLMGRLPTNGSILASPVIDSKKGFLYCCNLKGELFSINIRNKHKSGMPSSEKKCIKNYSINWVYTIKDNKPIFTTPQLSNDSDFIYFGCVDGFVYCINTLEGKLIWKFDTGGPIFSSPCLFNHDSKLVIGSHSNYIYCIDVQHKKQHNHLNSKCVNNHDKSNQSENDYSKDKIVKEYEWRIKTKAPVFASPFFCSTFNTLNNTWDNRIYAVDIDGNLYTIKVRFNIPTHDPFLIEKVQTTPIEEERFDFEETLFNKKIKLQASNETKAEIQSLRIIKLSGPIFSSPFVINNTKLIVGSRDDHLYLLD